MSLYTTAQYDALIAIEEKRGAEYREAIDYLKQNPAVGMPATFGIGSDSYGLEITGITYYKTGAKAGQVKEIMAGKPDEVSETFFVTKSGRIQKRSLYSGFYGSLTIGFARDYWDPSF